MQIQWYPGHMAKAKRQLAEALAMVDVVVELLDARAPAASGNPDFERMFAQKDRVVLLNKADLADPACNRSWIQSLKASGALAVSVNSGAKETKKIVTEKIREAAAPIVERMRQKGVQKVVRAMIVGIPNVGKSTLINRIAGNARTQTGDKPGVTRSKQWVRIDPYLELLDTPGLLWPKLEDQKLAAHLAYIGSIKDDIMDSEELARGLLCELLAIQPESLLERYKKLTQDTPEAELLAGVCASRGFLLAGGAYDTERAAHIVLDEFRAGKLGRISLERPNDTYQ